MSQSIVFMDGFDNLQQAKSNLRGWSAVADSIQTGRFGGFCRRISTSSVSDGYHTRGLPSSYSTVIAGFAFRVSQYGAAYALFDLRAGATQTIRLRIDASSHLYIADSSGTTIVTGTKVLSANTWYYVEIKGVINGASGNVTVYVNGVQEIAQTTANFGSSNISTIAIGGRALSSGNTTNFDFDDMRVGDGTTGSLADFIGDTRIETIVPSADGANAAWTPSTGTSRAANVDELSGTYPNDDTDYNSTSNAGDKDTFDMSALSSTAGSIYAIQPVIYARKDDAGTRTIAPVIRHSGTDYDGTSQGITSSYASYNQIYQAMPNADPLTKARVDAAEYGVKLVA